MKQEDSDLIEEMVEACWSGAYETRDRTLHARVLARFRELASRVMSTEDAPRPVDCGAHVVVSTKLSDEDVARVVAGVGEAAARMLKAANVTLGSPTGRPTTTEPAPYADANSPARRTFAAAAAAVPSTLTPEERVAQAYSVEVEEILHEIRTTGDVEPRSDRGVYKRAFEEVLADLRIAHSNLETILRAVTDGSVSDARARDIVYTQALATLAAIKTQGL
jgi:hypothetical protein